MKILANTGSYHSTARNQVPDLVIMGPLHLHIGPFLHI